MEEYLNRAASEALERAYSRVVLVLGSSTMSSVVLSGLSLLFWPPLIYPSLAIFFLGGYISKRVITRAKKKISVLFKKYIYEINIKNYIKYIKISPDLDPLEFIERLEATPAVVDGDLAEEERRISASRWLARGGSRSIDRRMWVMLTAGGTAVAIPHLLMGEKLVALTVLMWIYMWKKI